MLEGSIALLSDFLSILLPLLLKATIDLIRCKTRQVVQ